MGIDAPELDGFELSSFTALGKEYPVYRAGSGPAAVALAAQLREQQLGVHGADEVAQRVDLTVIALRDAIDGDRSSAQRLTLTA